MRIAICPGSFDPVTKGHLDIIGRAAKLFDKIIVVVLFNPTKQTSFSLEERVALLRRAIGDRTNIEVDSYDGLLADYVKMKGASTIVKGLRAISDFEYEFQMALTNKQMNPDFETVFLTTSAQYLYFSSSVVKQIAQFNGDISEFIPDVIKEDVMKRLSREAVQHGH